MIATNLMDMLQLQANRYGDKTALSYWPDGTAEQDRISYRELDVRARAIAADLQRRGAAGRHVLLACEPGIYNAIGYFGCIYAGAIPAPMNENITRLKLIAADINAGFVLATTTMQTRIRGPIDALTPDNPPQWCLLDDDAHDAHGWMPPQLGPDDVALIQYTSGSTKAPKGVMVSHRNLLHNMEVSRRRWNGHDGDIAMWWLPQHHDMGLIGGMLEMLYTGITTYLMAPNTFIKRPLSWLEMLSRHRVTITGGPTFAFDLCVKTTTPAQRAALDLSSVIHAWIGTEPVRAATLQDFAAAFAPAGFQLNSIQAAFGLAEAALLVTAMQSPEVGGARYVDRGELSRNHLVDVPADHPDAVPLVSCGPALDDMRVLIVDPETRLECPPDRVGEIWTSGPSVALGYWGRPEETERTFGARLADSDDGPYLRTGDLGFLCAGELFVTGRWSDLITIRDVNYYPNDIEDTASRSDPALMPGRCAAFTVRPGGGADEQLVVVQEVNRASLETDLTGAIEAIRARILATQGIAVNDVLLVEPTHVPTTTSGKIQRSAARERFQAGGFTPVAEWHAQPAPKANAGRPDLGLLGSAFKAAAQRRSRQGR
ncbi:fatty acyl-AMP ligase [[Mycobacterium] kokjensenii]|uniref:Fatty acyl-AMP ligase n=1 Tax=[Mycobacterium] kokjensenii TaxID=3064287 RepID=A0ABN9NI83_9MYCO|nr:fatty acyl-AMP ligase [Mycolicibacter sp. MU0083]CAJ1505473.1 fatty acyl-AMP ligase [Mycolicibacter sp. MU0083]